MLRYAFKSFVFGVTSCFKIRDWTFETWDWILQFFPCASKTLDSIRALQDRDNECREFDGIFDIVESDGRMKLQRACMQHGPNVNIFVEMNKQVLIWTSPFFLFVWNIFIITFDSLLSVFCSRWQILFWWNRAVCSNIDRKQTAFNWNHANFFLCWFEIFQNLLNWFFVFYPFW